MGVAVAIVDTLLKVFGGFIIGFAVRDHLEQKVAMHGFVRTPNVSLRTAFLLCSHPESLGRQQQEPRRGSVAAQTLLQQEQLSRTTGQRKNSRWCAWFIMIGRNVHSLLHSAGLSTATNHCAGALCQ